MNPPNNNQTNKTTTHTTAETAARTNAGASAGEAGSVAVVLDVDAIDQATAARDATGRTVVRVAGAELRTGDDSALTSLLWRLAWTASVLEGPETFAQVIGWDTGPSLASALARRRETRAGSTRSRSDDDEEAEPPGVRLPPGYVLADPDEEAPPPNRQIRRGSGRKVQPIGRKQRRRRVAAKRNGRR